MKETCETCGREVEVLAPARVTCRGEVRPGQPSLPDIGHDIQWRKP